MSRLFRHPYTKALQENAKLLSSDPETYQKMLGTVMTAAGATAAASLATAAAKNASIAKLGLLKTVSSVVATTVGVVTIGATSAAIAIPPSIKNVYTLESQSWTQSTIVIETGSAFKPHSVVVYSDQGESAFASAKENGRYEIVVHQNGTYHVEVASQGGKTATADIVVSTLDSTIPSMDRYTVDGDRVTLYLSDSQSGILWNSITANNGAETILPLEVNPDAGSVVFPTPEANLEIYVSDAAGNQAVASIQVVEE